MSQSVTCHTCGKTIRSKRRHDFVVCDCGIDDPRSIFVDGGNDYFRFGWGVDAVYTIHDDSAGVGA